MDDITQPIGPPVPQQPGTATPGHTHGPNLPEVAAATPDERARAEALWKASVANAERWRADGRVLDPTRPETLVYWNGPGDLAGPGRGHVHRAQGASGPRVGGPITRWHDHESCRDPATGARLGRPVDGACPQGQVYRRSGEMMHVWFADDLATAFARRPPPTALRAGIA